MIQIRRDGLLSGLETVLYPSAKSLGRKAMEPLFLTQGELDSSLTPLFLVHAISGLAIPYLALGSLTADGVECADGRPVYGINSPSYCDDGSRRFPSSFDEIACQYIAIIQSVQPEGPYLLGGWSLGGMIALKMAVVLEERGEVVRSVIMIDSANPNYFPQHINSAEHEMIAMTMYNNIANRMKPATEPIEDDSPYSTSEDEAEDELSRLRTTTSPTDSSNSDYGDGDLSNIGSLPDVRHASGSSTPDSDDYDNGLFKPSLILRHMRHHISKSLHIVSNERNFLQTTCLAPVVLIKCTLHSPSLPFLRSSRQDIISKLFQHDTLGWQPAQFRRFETIGFNALHDDAFDEQHAGELTGILRKVLRAIP